MKNWFSLVIVIVLILFLPGSCAKKNVWKGTAYGTPPWEVSEADQPAYQAERDAIEKLLYEHVVIEDGRFVFTADRDSVVALGLPDHYYEKFLDLCKASNRSIASQNRKLKKMKKKGIEIPFDDIREGWEMQCRSYAETGQAQIPPVAVNE